jgi:GDP/UDP-N,N'-diacetylbacillosamine 2-epimerase (hydrolysing)
MNMKRKVCVVTGSRSEYGLMKPFISLLQKDKDIALQLIVTGTHLSAQFGMTYNEIRADGFKADEKVDIVASDDTGTGVARSMGLAMPGFARAYAKLRPDIVVGMGDRFEMFSAFAAAMVSRIPIAHLSGGEISEGAFDDILRHAMTKMSSLHFVSNQEARDRVIQLGEQPDKVFNVGEVGLDRIKNTTFLTRAQLEKDLRFFFKDRNILITFHPVTMTRQGESLRQLKVILESLETIDRTQFILTKANADPEGRSMNKLLAHFVAHNQKRAVLFSSLGSLRYLSLMNEVDLVLGNSSSSLVEAPSLHKAAINIGERQKGRSKANNVIDCPANKTAILAAIKKAYTPLFIRSLKNIRNPYGDGHSSQRIVTVLKKVRLDNLLMKKFYDLK